MNKVQVIVVRVGKQPVLEEMEDSLEGMQKVVGGYFEMLPLGNGLSIYCNEEGRLLNLPVNRRWLAKAPTTPQWLKELKPFVIVEPGGLHPDTDEVGYHEIRGDFFVCGHDENGELRSLTNKKQIDTVVKFFSV